MFSSDLDGLLWYNHAALPNSLPSSKATNGDKAAQGASRAQHNNLICCVFFSGGYPSVKLTPQTKIEKIVRIVTAFRFDCPGDPFHQANRKRLLFWGLRLALNSLEKPCLKSPCPYMWVGDIGWELLFLLSSSCNGQRSTLT